MTGTDGTRNPQTRDDSVWGVEWAGTTGQGRLGTKGGVLQFGAEGGVI